ncbi:putative o-succinylbenzoate--CoA ligase [Rosa chinensis]|uniref:Putative o-succinylbenzoate--CoA ligase n=1 Tax=Rosa chinensis TaxID=74649 RepID=A0A2P6Q644_ROSCH|nr:2-succinylbenzoate--CoA ligase, chloroplastic/peroxisomal isoform X1 [Rosa chinensis]PRQ29647.1 putative o-succinylbenzoate--CoA ligase [Rosa chinensis]
MGTYSDAHICHCLNLLSTLRRNSVVTVAGNRPKTGKEFVDRVMGLAHGLLQLGLQSGDVVSIAAFNSELYLEWLLAIAYVGAVAAPLNYRWSYEEAVLAMEVVRPAMLVSDDSCVSWYSKLQQNDIPSLRWHVLLDPSSDFVTASIVNVLTTETIRKQSGRDASLDYCWAPEGAVIICFTSGTSGRPKGVAISHSAFIVQSLAKIAVVGYDEEDVYLHTAPLCHIGGLSSALAMLTVGACHVFIPKFDAKSAIEAIGQHNVTSLITVPAMMADLVSTFRGNDTSKCIETVKKILNGGGGLSIELTKAATKLFPKAKLLSAYGMTETCSSLTFMTLYDPKVDQRKSHSVDQTRGICVGKPAPHVELKICADGSSDVGRILTRGPHVMLRYWNGSLANAAAESSSGVWLDTGDIGFIDDYGNVWLIGRANGRIKSGGENIYPEEVERTLLRHPGVTGVVVVGIPDARLTEMLVACVQIRENWRWVNTSTKDSVANQMLHISSEILLRYCKEKNLTGFKIPKKFIVWKKPFPLTTTGKIRRDQMRGEAMLHLQYLISHL